MSLINYSSGTYKSSTLGYRSRLIQKAFANAVRQIVDQEKIASPITLLVTGTSGVTLATATVLLNEDIDISFISDKYCKDYLTQDRVSIFIDDHIESGRSMNKVLEAFSITQFDYIITITSYMDPSDLISKVRKNYFVLREGA